MTVKFEGSFTQQEPIPEDAIEAAIAVMRHGRLHRYNTQGDEVAETALLETEFANFTGAKYCLAVASGGYAMGCVMRALGIGSHDKVLTNAFTLAPVPGAIAAIGAAPVFVEVTENLVIDLDDLSAKIESSGAKTLLLSHMRGHLCDMKKLMMICDKAGVKVVEDCAHTMGATWDGVASGRFGVAGCYSTQTYKHMNSGEGGLIVTDDPDLMAKMTILSGSYMLYERHDAAPPAATFDQVRYVTPNVSGRMDNLRAAILRPQLRTIDQAISAWNARYDAADQALRNQPGIRTITRPTNEFFVGSSIQFLVPDFDQSQIQKFLSACLARGVELKWFGAREPVGFTSNHSSWRYAEAQNMPQTDKILGGLIDMRLPLTFTLEDCDLIGQIIVQEAREIAKS